MNGHPRRDTDVISRLSKSTIEDVSFYVGFTMEFLTLRVTSSAHPVPALAPKGPKIAPKWCQHGAKNLQNRAKMGPRGPEMEAKWGQDGVKTANKSEKNANATKKWVEYIWARTFCSKR